MWQGLHDYYRTTTDHTHTHLIVHQKDFEKLREKKGLQNLITQFGEMKEWPRAWAVAS